MPRMGLVANHNVLSATHIDVDPADTPADQEVMTWEAATSRWISQAAPGAGSGEANTATNVGVGGVSIVNGKVGVDLQFRSVIADSAKLTVTLDGPNNEVGLDLGTVAHSDISSVTSDQHHAQLHAAAHADGGADELAVQDLASDVATDGQVAKANGSGATAFEDDLSGLTFIIDGGGSAITTGLKYGLEIPFACVIEGWTLLADVSGSIVIDVWKDTYANFPPTVADTIAGSEKPTLSSVIKNQDLSLTTWTTAVAQGDILYFNVDSITTCTLVMLSLRLRKT